MSETKRRGNFGGDDPLSREHLDMRLIIFRLYDAINNAAASGDVIAFQSLVNRYRDSLPSYKRIEVEDEVEVYSYDDSHWEAARVEGDIYSDNPHAPTLGNLPGIRHNSKFNARTYDVEYSEDGDTTSVTERFEEGGVNWVSPIWVKSPGKIDYEKLCVLVTEKFEEMGYLFRTDDTLEEHGFVKGGKRMRSPTLVDPTPYTPKETPQNTPEVVPDVPSEDAEIIVDDEDEPFDN